jgi:hypothetical protein
VAWDRWSNTVATSFARHNPAGFFLSGYVKDLVYRTQVPNNEEMKRRIAGAIATINAEILQRTWREIEYRIDVLCSTKSAHVEVY